MTTNNTPNVSSNPLVIAGSYGEGALTGWQGCGTLTREQIAAVLTEAGLPAEWAPKSKSAIGYAGQVLSAYRNRGIIVRRARAAKWSDESKTVRAYRARWIVAQAHTANGVGDTAGEVILTVEIHDNSDDLVVDGDTALAAEIVAEYTRLMDAEILTAGDVTAWLKSVLVGECGATKYAMGYYVPAAGRDTAEALVAGMSRIWGSSWAAPLLPVATSDQLKTGIARSFYEEIKVVEAEIFNAENEAIERGKMTLSPTKSANFLKSLSEFMERVEPYTALCGADIMAPVIAVIRNLRDKLEPLTHDSVMRFANLELNDVAAPTSDKGVHVAPAVREERESARGRVEILRPVEPAPEPEAPKQATLDEAFAAADRRDPLSPAEERFSLLELD